MPTEIIKRGQYNYNELVAFCEYLKYADWHNKKRLLSCSAETFEIFEGDEVRYTVLKSYNTIIAYYDHDGKAFVDVLRAVYGYTATSAQHIAKFKKQFDVIKFDLRFC